MADAMRWMPFVLPLHTLRRVLMVLLTGLVLVQSIGQLHRVAHAHDSSSALVVPVQQMDHAPSDSTAKLLARLWGEHSTLVDCQLFDQTCPDLWVMHTHAWMPLLPVPSWTAMVMQERFALFERFYAARGPPPSLN